MRLHAFRVLTARRRGLAASSALTALAACCLVAISAAPAGAADSRQPYLNPTEPFTLTGYCSFPVEVDVTRSNEYIIHESIAPDGTKTQKVTGYQLHSKRVRARARHPSESSRGTSHRAISLPDGRRIETRGPRRRLASREGWDGIRDQLSEDECWH